VNVLLLTHRLPYAPNRGDRIRAYHLVRALAQRHDVSLLSLVHDAEEASRAPEVGGVCIDYEVVPVPKIANRLRGALGLASHRPLTHALLSAPGVEAALQRLVAARHPAVVVAYGTGMARYVFEQPLRHLPFVLDMVDVDSEKWREQAKRSSAPMRWVYARERRTLAAFEVHASTAAATTLVANERERLVMAGAAPDADVRVVPNGIDAAWFAPTGPPLPSSTVVFAGVMNYAPNVEAVVWFVTRVWPLVLARRPEARLVIVGASPAPAVQALAGDKVTVTGRVEDTRPFLWRAAVSVAPLLQARGIQNKVLEAVAAGLPTVITPVVSEGLPAEVMPAVRVASSAEPFATAVVDMLALSPDDRRRLAGSAGLDGLTWTARLAPLTDILSDAARQPRR
jgi:polysaccharide biosynthesis protein PslH